MPPIETNVKAADYSTFSKLTSPKLLLIDFIAYVISALLDEEYLEALLHLVCDHLILPKFADLHRIHERFHKLAIHFIVISIERESQRNALKPSLPSCHFFDVFLALLVRLRNGANNLCGISEVEQASEFPQELPEEKFGVDLGLAT